jgi:superfamily I DNA and RNA helicase
MSTADTIYELVKTLPEEQADLVLKFTQFVKQQNDVASLPQIPPGTLTGLRGIAKSSKTAFISSTVGDEHQATHEERLALTQNARGRFSHLPNSSEFFAQRKQEDIDWEDRNR